MTEDNAQIVTVQSDNSSQFIRDVAWVHVDVADDVRRGRTYIYAFDSEEQVDALNTMLDELRGEYIFAYGVVFPAWMREYIDGLSNEELQSVLWVGATDIELTEEVVEDIRAYHQSDGE